MHMSSCALVRRSSNAKDISSFEQALGFGRTVPEKRRWVTIPVGHASLQRLLDFFRSGADTPSQGALAEDFPEALDEIEPRGALGQGNEK